MAVVMIVELYGLKTDGAGAEVSALSIPSIGDPAKVNGGGETLMKWLGLKIICRCFISTGMRRMLSADGPDVACQPKLNGRWQPALNRRRMAMESLHINDSFRGAMKHLHRTERIWIGGIWVASMSDRCPPVIARSGAAR